MKKIVVTVIVLSSMFVVLSFSNKQTDPYFQFHENLSEYNFFKGELNQLQPADDIIPYDLNTPLFTDYAEKARFIKVPAGKKISRDASKHNCTLEAIPKVELKN